MPARPMRLGVAGLGRAFTLMLPTFLADARVELVAACDPREEARAQFERDFRGRAYPDIDAMLADSASEAIYIATPHQFHAEHTGLAARQKKHVLVEKPMALSLAACDRMIAACKDAGVHLIVGHSHSFDSPYLQTRRIVDSGEFGRVKMIHALNYTDFLYRPRRPEELRTEEGGGVVFSQAAHQIDVVRLLAGSRVTRVRAATGSWDAARPTEGAYAAMLWFEDGAFASLTYSGYAHFDSDEWCGWVGEMGDLKDHDAYGETRRKLSAAGTREDEARTKAAVTYGGANYRAPLATRGAGASTLHHQHFGSLIVSCEHADLRPMPDAVLIYGDARRERRPLEPVTIPRYEVIAELYAAVIDGERPVHDGTSARQTLQVCLALLESAREQRDVLIEKSS